MARRRSPFDSGERRQEPRVLFGKAVAEHRAGRHRQAERLYRSVLKHEKEFADGHWRLALLLDSQGRRVEALQSIERALRIDPGRAEFHRAAGGIHLKADRIELALAAFRRAAEIDPREPGPLLGQGLALRRGGRFAGAEEAYRRVLELDPSSVPALWGLGTVLIEVDRIGEAVGRLEEALAIDSSQFGVWTTLATAHQHGGALEQAIECGRRAVELAPQLAGAHRNLGATLQDAGRTDEAVAAFRRAIELAPDEPLAHFNLALARRHTERDAEVSWLERCAARPERFGAERHAAWYAMSRVCDQLGDGDAAFEWLRRSNAAMRATFDYDVGDDAAHFARVRAVFDAAALARGKEVGSADATPVFVVGMPRSGTSLIEQILASHPDVFGAGELEDIRRLAEDVARFPGGYPDGVAAAPGPAPRAAAEEYLRRLRVRAPGAARIVDKMPTNFVFLGAISLMLPNARIIHCVRDRRDTCTSLFKQMFSGHVPFAYDQLEIARYHGLYAELMDHWRSVVDADRLLDVRYEAVVDDLEGQSRRMCAFLGLPWHDACLRFFETERLVRTASQAEVRQPPYRSSIGSWERYADRLAEMYELLDRSPGGH